MSARNIILSSLPSLC